MEMHKPHSTSSSLGSLLYGLCLVESEVAGDELPRTEQKAATGTLTQGHGWHLEEALL